MNMWEDGFWGNGVWQKDTWYEVEIVEIPSVSSNFGTLGGGTKISKDEEEKTYKIIVTVFNKDNKYQQTKIVQTKIPPKVSDVQVNLSENKISISLKTL
jgi:hypothetical protein